jgi:NADPH:quinone reductase-like Zn-dependent oxidoreductase
MKAAVIYEHGGPGSITLQSEYPEPRPAAGEVIVRVRACTLNYHDVFTRRGMPGIKVPMPCIMGLDMSGEIVELGADVTGWKIGDRVMVDPIDRVGRGGLLGEMRPGGLAELCAVPVHQLVALPVDIGFEAAAAIPTAYGTALRMMYTIGKIQAGEKVLILGASGGVGSCCVQLAKLAGAEVIACASSEDKMRRLRDLGADHVVNYVEANFVDWVFTKYGKPGRRGAPGGVDVVVNFTGGDTWVSSLKILRRGGRILTCGATAGFDPKEDLRYIWSFELQVLGSNGWMKPDLTELLTLIQTKKLVPIIDRQLPLEDVNEAFRIVEDREVFGKILVRP